MKLSRSVGTVNPDPPRNLTRDLHDAYTELLSAQCAVDRLRRNHRHESIMKSDPEKLKSMLSTARMICEFYSTLGKSLGK